MNNKKRFLALGLAAMMTMSMTGCGGSTSTTTPNGGAVGGEATQGNTATATTASDTKKIINIGSWWLQYYDSSHTSVEDDPTYSGLEIAHLKFDNVDKIEQKYNCEFYWQNLTYTGVQDSISTSILAGDPDCEIYMVNTQMGIPAQLNGLAMDLKTVLPADHDLFTDQQIGTFLDLGDGKACLVKRVEAATVVGDTYPLAFNKQLLEDNNLEDPRELYARGEWTWDKFIEYCQTLTQDTDGDGQIDQYGYCGFINETFEQLMMSNGANVASGTTEQLSSAQTGEALQLIYDMYNTYNVCYPYDFESGSDSDTMRFQYRDGKIAFWPGAAWIASQNADYDYTGENGTTLSFDTVYVQWPIGPSGNQETNAGKVCSGEFYMIPVGMQDAETIFNVLYDMWNWYDGDTAIRDDAEALYWWYAVTAKDETIQNENFDVMYDIGSRETFELWNSLGISYEWTGLIKGEVTAAQFQETYKNQVQDALDVYFN